MEVKKRSGEKRGGLNVKLGGLGGGGGGLVLVVGGAIVAGTVWSVCEFRRRRQASCKKGTLKNLQTPKAEKVKDVDGGDESHTEEKDSSAQNPLLDVEKRSELGVIEEGEEEEIQEDNKIQDDGSVYEKMVVYPQEDNVAYELASVHEKIQNGVQFCVDSANVDTLSVSENELSVSEDELAVSKDDGIVLDEKIEVVQLTTPERAAADGVKCEKKSDEVVQIATPESFTDDGIKCNKNEDEVVQLTTSSTIVADGNSDPVSEEDLDYEGEDGSEDSSRGTTDSSEESNTEATWPVESSEMLSRPKENEKDLPIIKSEIVEAELSETNTFAYGIYHSETNSDNVSSYEEGWDSLTNDQIVDNSTNKRIWVSSILLALLVLIVALLAHHKYFSPSLAPQRAPS